MKVLNNKRLTINLMANVIQFISSLIISFFFTPYITRTIGTEAYSFYTLAGNFISYFALITATLNSMASRYITIEWHKNNHDKVNQYFNTVLYANCMIGVLLSAIVVAFVMGIENFINVPVDLVMSVKLLFALVLGAGLVNTICSVFSTATFTTDRLELKALILLFTSIIKVVILLLLFLTVPPDIIYLGIANFVCTVIEVGSNILFTKRLMPDLKIHYKFFRIGLVKELVATGIWNSINQLNTILMNGLDVLMANLFLSVHISGVLGISKTIPTLIFSLTSMLGNVFLPRITIEYAQNNKKALIEQFEKSFKIMGFACSIIIAGYIVCGELFYRLWLPHENYQLLYLLSLLAMISLFATASTQTMVHIALLTNKLRVPVIITFIRSVVGLILVYFVIRNTTLGVYAIAGVSSLLGLIYDLCFEVFYLSKAIGCAVKVFYKYKIKMILSIVLLTILFRMTKYFISEVSWLSFFVQVFICLVIGTFANLLIYGVKRVKK